MKRFKAYTIIIITFAIWTYASNTLESMLKSTIDWFTLICIGLIISAMVSLIIIIAETIKGESKK